MPTTSFFFFSQLILPNTQLTFSKIFSNLHKTRILFTFKFAAILVNHSHQSSSVEVSRDVGSGTRDLNRDLSDFKQVGILLQSLHLVQNAGKVRYRSL